MATPDEIDLKILAVLNTNPRSSYEDIAYSVGISNEEVDKRIREMMDKGVIVSYGVKLREDVLNLLPPKESLREVEKKIILKKSDLIGLAQEVNRVFGSGSGIILSYAGFGIGQSIAAEEPVEKKDDAFKVFQKIFEEKGLGKVSIETNNSSSGRISFTESPLPKENPLHETLEMFLRGIFHGFLNKVFKSNKISLIKEQCIAKGDSVCVFSFKIEEEK
ncbi:MAG: AsnC family transcriptional regulator [Thermoproteota archaeon]